MGEISFDSDNNKEFGARSAGSTSVDFTGKLIKWGVVKNRQQAEYVMIGIAVVVIIIAFFVYQAST